MYLLKNKYRWHQGGFLGHLEVSRTSEVIWVTSSEANRLHFIWIRKSWHSQHESVISIKSQHKSIRETFGHHVLVCIPTHRLSTSHISPWSLPVITVMSIASHCTSQKVGCDKLGTFKFIQASRRHLVIMTPTQKLAVTN